MKEQHNPSYRLENVGEKIIFHKYGLFKDLLSNAKVINIFHLDKYSLHFV